MERMRARVTRALALGLVAGLASACLPESGDEAADAAEVSVRDLYPTVFKAVDFQSFSDAFGPELTELKKSDPGQYQAVIRGMARSIAFEPLSVSAEQMREKLPEATPFDDLPEAGSREFLKQFYDVSSDFLSEGGMTFESIQTIGEGHQKNAVTKYQNALYRYIEKLREKKVAVNAKNRKIQQLLDLVSFVQPTVQQDGAVLTIRVPARNGTDQALASLEVTVSAKTAAESWAEPEPIGATTVQFEENFLSKENRVLEFSVETEDYTGGQISLDVTELTTEGGFSINEQTMAEPIQVIDELISDAEWKRRMIEDELRSATERYP